MSESDQKRLGQAIRSLRRDPLVGLNIIEVADAVGIKATLLSDIELGLAPVPDWCFIEKIMLHTFQMARSNELYELWVKASNPATSSEDDQVDLPTLDDGDE